jgi:hypothetical protein
MATDCSLFGLYFGWSPPPSISGNKGGFQVAASSATLNPFPPGLTLVGLRHLQSLPSWLLVRPLLWVGKRLLFIRVSQPLTADAPAGLSETAQLESLLNKSC